MSQLSPNFSRAEFEHSDTAVRAGLPNVMNDNEVAAATALCVNVLEPLRAHFKRPVVLNSGFRSDKVNTLVGSSSKSQHRKGEAADIEIPGVSNLEVAQHLANSSIKFDQLILENYTYGKPSSGWVHVSFKVGRARRSILTMTLGSHGPVYTAGINP